MAFSEINKKAAVWKYLKYGITHVCLSIKSLN